MSLDSARFRLPDAHSLALQIGAGRTAIAAGIMAAPVLATRMLGADTATAQRVTWLTRMLAVRDGAIGVGTATAARSGGGAGWVLAGAASDAVDAIVLAAAVKQGRLRGLVPTATVVLAAATAGAGFVTAARLRR